MKRFRRTFSASSKSQVVLKALKEQPNLSIIIFKTQDSRTTNHDLKK